MKKAIDIYTLLVCFVSLAIGSIAFGAGVWNLVGLYYPQITITQSGYVKFQDDMAFLGAENDNTIDYSILADGDIKVILSRKYNLALQHEIRNRMQGLLSSSIIFCISLLIYFPHWTLARRDGKTIK